MLNAGIKANHLTRITLKLYVPDRMFIQKNIYRKMSAPASQGRRSWVVEVSPYDLHPPIFGDHVWASSGAGPVKSQEKIEKDTYRRMHACPQARTHACTHCTKNIKVRSAMQQRLTVPKKPPTSGSPGSMRKIIVYRASSCLPNNAHGISAQLQAQNLESTQH